MPSSASLSKSWQIVADTPEGREALIHLHVPAELKARWVQASRADGMKLRDWIISKVERPTMNVFKVPQAGPLSDKYHGAGYALAAIVAGQLVDLVYLADALPDFGGEEGPTRADVQAAITSPALGPTVRRLQALGEVHVGMLSCWEFCEL